MGKTVRTLATFGCALGITLGAASTASAATAPYAQRDYQGCKMGYVCVYPSGSWNGGSPELRYYTYGVHKFYNHTGTHRWFNNQTDGWTTRLCKNANGTDCTAKLYPWSYRDINFTPYNSLRIDKS